jgi:hypothetical protein
MTPMSLFLNPAPSRTVTPLHLSVVGIAMLKCGMEYNELLVIHYFTEFVLIISGKRE